jgi:murein DD-endopeptidase MepM/ murein hydrolase activator NlpD
LLVQTAGAEELGAVPRPRPAPGNPVVPLLRPPFDGDFELSNLFDHDLPFEFRDENGYALTFWGEQVWPGIDGHDGLDFRMPEGTPLLAAADGVVVRAGRGQPFKCPILGGRQVAALDVLIVHHAVVDGERVPIRTQYLHLSHVDVVPGQQVAAGEQIGLSGNTGCSTAPHLHFAVYRRPPGRGFVAIDPYGWDGPDPDPWASHERGAASLWLWLPEQAPPIRYRERVARPNFNDGDDAPVALTRIAWLGWRDDEHPNDEYAELTLDPAFAPTGAVDLTGFTLRDDAGEAFAFPPGFTIRAGRPVRVYGGAGAPTDTSLFWDRGGRAFDAMGDCVRLVRPNGRTMYRLSVGGGSCG